MEVDQEVLVEVVLAAPGVLAGEVLAAAPVVQEDLAEPVASAARAVNKAQFPILFHGQAGFLTRGVVVPAKAPRTRPPGTRMTAV